MIMNDIARLLDLWRHLRSICSADDSPPPFAYVFYGLGDGFAPLPRTSVAVYIREKWIDFQSDSFGMLATLDTHNLEALPKRLRDWHRKQYDD